jgi:hypothetical protein
MARSPTPRKHRARATRLSPVMKHDIGALLVGADLLRQGFVVFRKLGQASPCDFMILRGRQSWRVAVRIVRSVSLGGQIYSRCPRNPERFDVLAYVMPDGKIRYEPPLEHLRAPDTGTATTSSPQS